MGRNRLLRKQIASLEEQIAVHEKKVAEELAKSQPNYNRIEHWEAEIAAAAISIERKRKRLGSR